MSKRRVCFLVCVLFIFYIGICDGAYFEDVLSNLYSRTHTATVDFSLDSDSLVNQVVSVDGNRKFNIDFLVENTGNTDVYVRFNVIPVISDKDDANLFYKINSFDFSAVDQSLWREGGDGYIYYNNSLEEGGILQGEFSAEIEFDKRLETQDIELSIYVESVQTRNQAYQDAW